MRRCTLIVLVSFLFLFLVPVANLQAQDKTQRPRVIVLGFDGVAPQLLEKYLDEGQLPNLEKLRQSGTFSTLATTNPAQSPVSWSSFATGMNPGKTGIFDFLRRKEGSYLPDLAFVRETEREILPDEGMRHLAAGGIGLVAFVLVFILLRLLLVPTALKRKSVLAAILGLILGVCVGVGGGVGMNRYVPKKIPVPVNNREGTAFWKYTSDKGIRTMALFAPMSFPAEDLCHGSYLVCGLGVPDVRKTNGFWTFYTSEKPEAEDTITGGTIIQVNIVNNVAVNAQNGGDPYIPGPRNFLNNDEPINTPVSIKIHSVENMCEVTVQGKSYRMSPGTWSDWVEIDYQLNPLFRFKGATRFRLMRIDPKFELYLEPVTFDPEAMPATVKISSPFNYASQLSRTYGKFETVGWTEATNPLKDEKIDEQAFIEDAYFAFNNHKRIALGEMAKQDWDCFFTAFMLTDRVQHMFWRNIDPESPLYNLDMVEKYGDQILKAYQAMDEVVGEVRDKYMDDRTALFVISDHGFRPFRKEFNINTWLVQNGFMTLRSQAARSKLKLTNLFYKRELWSDIDWRRTKAYAMGLGKIFVNLKGRDYGKDFDGVVQPGAEYDALLSDISERLENFTDPTSGRRPVRKTYRTQGPQGLYTGKYIERTGDMEVGFDEGYRVSWQTTLGGIPDDIVENNRNKWSGDHCSVDPELVPGIFLSNMRLETPDPRIMDFAPTILRAYGIDIPADMDGKLLRFASGVLAHTN